MTKMTEQGLLQPGRTLFGRLRYERQPVVGRSEKIGGSLAKSIDAPYVILKTYKVYPYTLVYTTSGSGERLAGRGGGYDKISV